MIAGGKAFAKRHWPRLRLRTILLLTFVFVAALPGAGALFLRVYENTLVRQTEAELVAQGAALAAVASVEWPAPTSAPRAPPALLSGRYQPEATAIDLRSSPVLGERPAPVPAQSVSGAGHAGLAAQLRPIFAATSRTSLASIIMVDETGGILIGPHAGMSYAAVPEVRAALAGRPATVLRRNGAYRRHYLLETLSRASDLRIHHARPIVSHGRVVGALLLSRSPRALFRGLYEDLGKILFGIAAIFAALVVLSVLLSRGIARPIEVLSRTSREVARGHGIVPDPPATAAIEIQALYADFATMAEALERRSRYLRDFAHAVSHEFKTPLAGIRGAVELLQDHHDTMAEADRRRFLANAAVDAERLTLLVTRLLDLARADMARVEAGSAGDLALATRRLADAYASPGFRVTLDIGEPPPVAMPTSTIEAVLASLIENSRQAVAGEVTIVAAIDDTSDVLVTIRDDGPGIAPGDRARVFEPFFTSKRASGGSGLGLAIARSLSDACGGSLEVAVSDCGAAFELVLPRASGAAA